MQTNFKEELLMKKARKIIGGNSIFQIVQDDATKLTSVEKVIDSWR